MTLRHRFEAWADLWKRYGAHLRYAWNHRAELTPPHLTADEAEFLPAALSLQTKPVSPAGRWVARILILLIAGLFVWVTLGRIDIIATATGKLVPDARVKVIQPAITGVVREIAVHDGDRVVAGQLLMQLDTTQASADADKAKSTKLDATLLAARAHALLNAQQTGTLPHIDVVDGVPASRQKEAQRFAEGIWREYKDKLIGAQAELLKRRAELDSTRQEIAKLVATAPLAREQANEYRVLAANKYVAQSDYLDKEQAALGQEHELAAQRSHAAELLASVAVQRAQIEQNGSEFRRTQFDELEKATEQLSQSRNDETKANARESLMKLTAPVAGTVQQLAVHTLGGVVTTAQSLMEIVPDDALQADVVVENKNIGFLQTGQRAAVKIEAFPYSRYGMIEGEVSELSNDAVQDKKQGLVFNAHIHLKTNQMWVDKRWIPLTPGMTVTADIKTGTQTIAQYFLGPLVDGVTESMHER
ncbi:hemolysin D (plasmid) [Burkholderia sp. MSMB0856]|uniref:HlyD family type I secretion periplasmic adaptor subunit n=1 Tax=Burkholderia sp. MSMB0856 TaxID=1637869 RepID=UPI000855C205|nr:HlyD family type I secretion periplasmic adaptor subunit [Burkholderia sp. MSMB0856]AOJ85286.1 hemolysin D [Burkholderia sp. MSMB0856]